MPKQDNWTGELALLSKIIEKTGLEKTIKWGTPVYTLQGKNVLGIAAFTNYIALWFYNGAFLTDRKKVLINAQEGKTRGLRQWRFYSRKEISEKLILAYVKQAIKNEEAGKKIKPQRSAPLPVPQLLQAVLNNNKMLQKAFDTLPPYKQKEYIEYLNEAKREDTRNMRLEKIKPLIAAGTGLHDKYKKS